MKKRMSAALLALALAVGLLAMPASAGDWETFSDVPYSHWAFDEVERAFIAGAMNGMSYNEQTGVRTFAPKGQITVAQFLAILVRSGHRYELWMDETSAEKDWSAPYVAVAREQGLLDGLEGIDLKAPVTRYQMAVMISNDIEDELTAEQLQTARAGIADWDAIPAQYQSAVARVYYFGIINGRSDGSFDGNAAMNRAEAAAVYCRMADKLVTPAGELGGAACGENEWLRTRWFDFKVFEGSRTDYWAGWAPPEGMQFVTLFVKLRSTADEAIPMSCNEFVLGWGVEAGEFDLPAVAPNGAGDYDVLGDDHLPKSFELAPGEETYGWLVYLAPEGVENYVLFYVEEFADGTYGDRFYVELKLNHSVG